LFHRRQPAEPKQTNVEIVFWQTVTRVTANIKPHWRQTGSFIVCNDALGKRERPQESRARVAGRVLNKARGPVSEQKSVPKKPVCRIPKVQGSGNLEYV
jgi:hypothetical protein